MRVFLVFLFACMSCGCAVSPASGAGCASRLVQTHAPCTAQSLFNAVDAHQQTQPTTQKGARQTSSPQTRQTQWDVRINTRTGLAEAHIRK